MQEPFIINKGIANICPSRNDISAKRYFIVSEWFWHFIPSGQSRDNTEATPSSVLRVRRGQSSCSAFSHRLTQVLCACAAGGTNSSINQVRIVRAIDASRQEITSASLTRQTSASEGWLAKTPLYFRKARSLGYGRSTICGGYYFPAAWRCLR